MKYIRTKDGKIYLINSEFILLDGDKQADTIEELCDEFVYNKMTFKTLEETLDYAPIGSDIYGAIWTDKGLTYVAKMNDKGELELL